MVTAGGGDSSRDKNCSAHHAELFRREKQTILTRQNIRWGSCMLGMRRIAVLFDKHHYRITTIKLAIKGKIIEV